MGVVVFIPPDCGKGSAAKRRKETLMIPLDVILFDVGGVALTNGWDRKERAAAGEHSTLDTHEFWTRHGETAPAWERGEIDLNEVPSGRRRRTVRLRRRRGPLASGARAISGWHSPGVYALYTTYRAELEKARNLGPTTLAIMHGSSFTGACARALNDLIFPSKRARVSMGDSDDPLS